jgi:hypothetical protein
MVFEPASYQQILRKKFSAAISKEEGKPGTQERNKEQQY